MNLDINTGTNEAIVAFEGDVLQEIKTIVLTVNGTNVDLTGLKCDMAYVDVNNNSIGDILENMNISNPKKGEISLPINTTITKKNGTYDCELKITSDSGYTKYTSFFRLVIKSNLFNKIAKPIINNSTFSRLQEILKESEDLKETLEENIPKAVSINQNLYNNIAIANPLNIDLSNNSLTASEKNTELNKSLEETKKFINGLDGSQNIPQIRLDVTELQNGLKNNQSLEYEGSNLTCENTYDGRTEGMTIEGMIYKNLVSCTFTANTDITTDYAQAISLINAPLLKSNTKYTIVGTSGGSYQFRLSDVDVNGLEISMGTFTCGTPQCVSTHNNYAYLRLYAKGTPLTIPQGMQIKLLILEGDYTNKYVPPYFEGIKSVGEDEGGKISILSRGKNLFNVKNLQNYGEGFKLIDATTNTFEINNNQNIEKDLLKIMNIDLSNKSSFTIKMQNEKKSGAGIGLFRVFYKNGTDEYVGNVDGGKYTRTISNAQEIKKIIFSYSNYGVTKFSDIFFCTTDSLEFEPYKEDKKEILLPYEGGHKGFVDGAKDTIEERKDGVWLTKKVEKATLNDIKNYYIYSEQNTDKVICFYSDPVNNLLKSKLISDKFNNIPYWNYNGETIGVDNINGKNRFFIKIEKSKLEIQDVDGFKKWLQANPTTVYYEMENPTETKLLDISDLDLDTYNTVTNIMSNNAIPATLKFKIASNLGSLIQNNAKSINDLYKLIDEIVMPGLQKTMAASLLNNIK